MKKIFLILMLASGFIYSDASAQNTPSQKDKETFDKIVGVWTIKDIDEGTHISKSQKKENKKLQDEMLKDSYMYFKSDSTLEFHVATNDADGSWKISVDGRKLIMTNNDLKHADSVEILKLSKTEATFIEAGTAKFKLFLVKQSNALTDEQQKKHVESIAIKKQQDEDYTKQAYADSVAAAKAYQEVQHNDSVANAMGERGSDSIEFAPCYYLKLICKPFEMNALNIKLEKVSENESYNFYKCQINLPEAKRCEYGFEKSQDRPLQFNAIFGENLSENDALELYKKEIYYYKTCNSERWSESMHREDNGRWSYTEFSGGGYGFAKEVSIEMNLEEKNRTYTVRLHIEEEQ